jgi:hypothetical protein
VIRDDLYSAGRGRAGVRVPPRGAARDGIAQPVVDVPVDARFDEDGRRGA